jgi:S-DNA-T family DNA segregation ATPase FtsK/SpoIIIE
MTKRTHNANDLPQAGSDVAWDVLERILPYLDDLLAVLTASIGLVTLLGLMGLTQGALITPWVTLTVVWLGLGAWIVPILLGGIALSLIRRSAGRPVQIPWGAVISGEIAGLALLGLLGVMEGLSLTAAESGFGGGLVGWGIGTLVAGVIGLVGAGVFLGALCLVFGFFSLQGLLGAVDSLNRLVARLQPRTAEPGSGATISDRSGPTILGQKHGRAKRRSGRLPEAYRKDFKLPDAPDESSRGAPVRDQKLPPLGLLEGGALARVSEKEINRAAGLIEKTLADFGLPVRVVDFRSGPSVTQFAVEPGYVELAGPDGTPRRHKVRVSQISGLANDLALALSAPRLRIEAPVPGRSYLGVEVPNQRAAIVRLRPILESEAFVSIGSALAIGLGRDVAGAAVAADLAAMPHLLIAGTTGSGKSVAITALATCLAMSNSPDDLRLVMVDPKMVELVRFNGLPHLFGKVETDLERIVGVLRWCTMEMDRRYRLLENAHARDIDAYNSKARRSRETQRLPRVVVMIDELADLMMMAPDQTEQTLVRLAQMARAVGIHLVVATQRPSTDIVTGLIKANFPARMSFATASGTDSRVILDTPGAETLLGRGDMLYLAPEASAPVRIQGAFIDDKEVDRLIRYWQQTAPEDHMDGDEEGESGAPWESLLVRQAVLEEHDDIIERAIEVVKNEGEASASLLQRRLRVGYPRAARLMDELEELGVVGRAQAGGKTREVLIDPNEDPLLPTDDEDGGQVAP